MLKNIQKLVRKEKKKWKFNQNQHLKDLKFLNPIALSSRVNPVHGNRSISVSPFRESPRPSRIGINRSIYQTESIQSARGVNPRRKKKEQWTWPRSSRCGAALMLAASSIWRIRSARDRFISGYSLPETRSLWPPASSLQPLSQVASS